MQLSQQLSILNSIRDQFDTLFEDGKVDPYLDGLRWSIQQARAKIINRIAADALSKASPAFVDLHGQEAIDVAIAQLTKGN